MTIIGTIYDVFIHQENLKKNEMNKIDDSKCCIKTAQNFYFNKFLRSLIYITNFIF
jgi:hypothetical protein